MTLHQIGTALHHVATKAFNTPIGTALHHVATKVVNTPIPDDVVTSGVETFGIIVGVIILLWILAPIFGSHK
jgi:hypothetical protein